MAKVLGVTRAGYDAWKNRAPQRGQRALAHRRLDEAVAWEHEVSGGTYGAPRIRHALMRAGVDVGVRAVAASMRRQGLTGLNTHPRPARRAGRAPVAHEDHCVRRWDHGALDRVWITDLTYLRCAQGWVYLCAVRDAHSRRVLGYAIGEQHNTDLVITALDMAATTRGTFPAGVVLHADRGTQFTSEKLAAYMRAAQGTVSMGRAGVWRDNAMAESFWATLTTEYYYRRTFTTRDQVYTGVATWIEDFYNRRRIHTSLGGTPHRIRTTPSGLDNSRINQPSTTCTQAQPSKTSSRNTWPKPTTNTTHANETTGLWASQPQVLERRRRRARGR